jgi:DNA-binding NarL/FixJ family response regulator
MDHQVRVLIADDNKAARKGIKALLDQFPQIQVVEEATNGNQAIKLTDAYQPDVVLIDIHMPVMDGLQAIRNIKTRWPKINVVVLTIDKLSRPEALAAGASEFLVKGCTPEDIQHAILNASGSAWTPHIVDSSDNLS